MAFPSGPLCNIECEYCYYLDKTKLYPDTDTDNFMMSEILLKEYIKQYIEAQPGPVVNFGWQGGEPTLRKLDFFKKAISFIERYLPEDWDYENSFQTNGILIDKKWAKFLSKNNFLVGLSMDGPAYVHDKYRKDKKGQSTHKRVIEGLKLLKKYNVEYNILCVVNNVNAQYPVEVYNHFKNLGAEHVQFIPIVEQEDGNISHRSVSSGQYGKFLISIFDEWLYNDLGEVFVQIFEQCVAAWAGQQPGLCIFNETCGRAAIMEHNGDVYSCDHFVLPEYKLGNIKQTHISNLVNSPQQQQFGNDKRDKLPEQCLNCDYLFMCHGGCPKNRVEEVEEGKKLNYLCEGYKRFYDYIDPYLDEIVANLRQHQSPPVIKRKMQKTHNRRWNNIGRNDKCLCGSGKKFKKCCYDRKKSK